MIFYYAVGGGLGHLTRAQAFLYTLKNQRAEISQEPIALLSASIYTTSNYLPADWETIQIPSNFSADKEAYRNWLSLQFEEKKPSALYLDTFPAGIIGEFCDFRFPSGLEIFHVARLLRLARYEEELSGTLPKLIKTFLTEKLPAQQLEFLKSHSAEVVDFPLQDPPHELSEEQKVMLAQLPPSYWLIVHSGPAEEVAELVNYAVQMKEFERVDIPLVLNSPCEYRDERLSQHVSLYPTRDLFPAAGRIITGGGFNLMRETSACKEKHRFLPFPRTFDDQMLRGRLRNGVESHGGLTRAELERM